MGGQGFGAHIHLSSWLHAASMMELTFTFSSFCRTNAGFVIVAVGSASASLPKRASTLTFLMIAISPRALKKTAKGRSHGRYLGLPWGTRPVSRTGRIGKAEGLGSARVCDLGWKG